MTAFPRIETMSSEKSSVRVAHFCSSLGVYGAERWIVTLLKYLDTQRISSVVVTVGAKPETKLLHEVVVEEGHKAFHMDVPGRLNPEAIRRLREFILRENIDVLHTHGFKSIVLGYLATLHLPVRLVSTLHGWSAAEGARIALYEAIGRIFLRRFDRLYPVSPALLQDMLKRGFDPNRLRLLLNAVDIAAFDSCRRRRKRCSPDNPLRILFAARLYDKSKGASVLINAMAKATFRCKATLRIAGEGPDRAKLEQLTNDLGLNDKVRFMGMVNDIGPLLAECDVLALPSFVEGIPFIILEAFSVGVPVIGSAIPGISELINHEKTGLLAPAGDADELARALERVAACPALADEMAVRARQRVERVFSASRLARDLMDEYEQLARPDPVEIDMGHDFGDEEPATE